jgi:putative OPT family oligopeptide transporter
MSSEPSAKFEPYIPASTKIPEFTFRAVLTGAILGLVFGASSLYLVLKVGLTVSASIPVAVISLALFRAWSKTTGGRDSTILENNITQTAGSAGESIAFGLGVTMPAILILGFDLELTRVLLVAIMGGLLGILMMIPLRRALIVKEHGVLKYPEGTACAAVLKAGVDDVSRAAASPSAKAEMAAAEAAGLGKSPGAKVIFTGFGIGLLYKSLNVAFKGWKDVPEKVFGAPLKAGSVSCEISPELVGVGYIIGPYLGGLMAAGGVLSYLVLIPLIKFFGEGLTEPLAPGTALISQMSPGQIRGSYVLYIGAGCVAAGGIISLVQALPTIWHGIKGGLKDFGGSRGNSAATSVERTDQDISLKYVGIGIVALLAAITFAPSLHMNLLGALLIIAFGFLFVTVSSRLTGEVGSTSNPISGMTVATLLFTCLVFLLIGWTGGTYYVTALSIGGIVCIASSNGGTTSQDLKTGYLVGATPKLQQYAILIGAFGSAVLLGPILMKLNDSAIVYVPAAQVAPAGLHVDVTKLDHDKQSLVGPQSSDDHGSYYSWHKTDVVGGPAGKYFVNDQGNAVWLVDPGINGAYSERPDGSVVRKFDAPKATLMSYIIKGILDQKLPWALVLFGAMITVALQMSFVPALTFAVGVYLPISSSLPIWIGGMIRWAVDRWMRKKPACAAMDDETFNAEADKSPGVLLASGYIAGGAIAGIIIAFIAGVPGVNKIDDHLQKWSTANNPFFQGPMSDALSLIPYVLLCGFLYFVAKEKFLAPKKN